MAIKIGPQQTMGTKTARGVLRKTSSLPVALSITIQSQVAYQTTAKAAGNHAGQKQRVSLVRCRWFGLPF